MAHHKVSPFLQGQGSLVRSQFISVPKAKQERSGFAWAVMAMNDGWTKPRWVTGGYGKFERARAFKSLTHLHEESGIGNNDRLTEWLKVSVR